jgi:hypothetical protein
MVSNEDEFRHIDTSGLAGKSFIAGLLIYLAVLVICN